MWHFVDTVILFSSSCTRNAKIKLLTWLHLELTLYGNNFDLWENPTALKITKLIIKWFYYGMIKHEDEVIIILLIYILQRCN